MCVSGYILHACPRGRDLEKPSNKEGMFSSCYSYGFLAYSLTYLLCWTGLRKFYPLFSSSAGGYFGEFLYWNLHRLIVFPERPVNRCFRGSLFWGFEVSFGNLEFLWVLSLIEHSFSHECSSELNSLACFCIVFRVVSKVFKRQWMFFLG